MSGNASREKPTLAEALHGRLRAYSMGTGFVLATLIGLGAGGVFFYAQAQHQEALLRAMTPYVASLAQNSDHHEIERVLSSFLEALPSGSSIRLVREGTVEVSLPDMQQALRPYLPVATRSIGGVAIGTDTQIYSVAPLQDPFSHASFGELVLNVPSRGPLWKALFSLQLSFISVWFLLALWRRLTRKTLTKALIPLQKLQADLNAVGRGSAPNTRPEEFEIKELSDISSLVQKQHQDVLHFAQMAAKTEGERGAKEAVQSLMHDLLNPYTALSNLVQAWMLYPKDQEIQERIRQDWPELNRQIKDLLKAARHAEVETFSPRRQSLLDTAHVGARLGCVKNPTVLRMVETETAGERGESWSVAHDSALLSRAVANLVRNSVEEGASSVEVWCERSPLSIHIRDNGPGIPSDKVCELFEGRLKSKKPDGSGIGFPTALRLIRLHGGKILLEKDTAGQSGAHFKIDLRALGVQA